MTVVVPNKINSLYPDIMLLRTLIFMDKKTWPHGQVAVRNYFSFNFVFCSTVKAQQRLYRRSSICYV